MLYVHIHIFTPYQIISCHITSTHIMPIKSYRVRSYHIIPWVNKYVWYPQKNNNTPSCTVRPTSFLFEG